MRKNYFFSLIALFTIDLLSAQIQYTDISPDFVTTVGANGQSSGDNLSPIDFNNDGVSEYHFFWFQANPAEWNLNVNRTLTTSSVAESAGPYCCQTEPLVQNATIGPALNWSNNTSSYIANTGAPIFSGLGDRYIGVRFKIGTNTHYGWILISVANKTLTVKSYAYQKTPDTPIAAGDKGSLSVSEADAARASGQLYPNPAKEYFTVTDGTVKKFAYEITDASGRMVDKGSADAGEKISIKFSTGTYMVKLKSEGKISVHKLVVK